MIAASDLASKLKAKKSRSGWTARCPAHEDHRESLSIGEGENGKILLKCFAGCSFDQILKAANVEPTKPNGEDRAKRRIVATYDYHDASGNLVFQVVRYAPKDFRQRRPDGNGGWIWKMAGVELVPYHLPALLNASEVFISEGEKDCDNLAKLGLLATTNPGGAGKWPDSFARWFDGRHVTILPDADDPGRKHAADVAAKLKDAAASIKILELFGLPEKADVSDWLANGGTLHELQKLASEEPYWEPGAAADPKPLPYTLLKDIKFTTTAAYIVKDLIPKFAFGSAFAAYSAGKTAIIVDLGLHIAAGLKYRERRVIAQPVIYVSLEGHGGIANRVKAAAQELGVEDAPFALVKAKDNFRDSATAQRVAAIATELQKQFGGDCPVIVIDTYTAALGGGASDCDPRDVSAFISAALSMIACGCTVLIIHHTGKDASRGGRGWSGLPAAIDFELEIDRDDDLRTMRVIKMRDGSDAQPAFCYNLRAVEIGADQYGDQVTTVVVDHLEDEDKPRKGKAHSPKARASLNILWTCIKDPAHSHPLPDQPRLRCVLLGTWENECAKPGAISECTEKYDRRKKFRAAKAELERSGAIICDGPAGERVYPAPRPRSDSAGRSGQ